MLIDTHCHLNFDAYDDDREQVLASAAAAGVKQIINPGIDPASNEAAVRLTQQFPAIFAAVGIHPNSTTDFTPAMLAPLREFATNPKVVSIGEIGLDYYWDKSPRDTQAKAFEAQLQLAAELELPVIIHNREASGDVLPILEAWAADLPPTLKDRPGVLHSFSAPAAYAERALAAGFYLGFTGPITYKKADDLRRVAARVPLDRILVETDGPFLTPHPHRGKRNEPAYIPLMVERLAALHQIDSAAMAKHTTDNARRLFKLPQA